MSMGKKILLFMGVIMVITVSMSCWTDRNLDFWFSYIGKKNYRHSFLDELCYYYGVECHYVDG